MDIRSIFALPSVFDATQDFVGANALKRRFLATVIPSDKPLRVLEVGCGPGRNNELDTDVIIYPTSACVIRAGYLAP